MREKKYTLLVDLPTLGLDVLQMLEEDNKGPHELVKGTYLITTSGGRGGLWLVREKTGQRFTVSTESLRTIKVNHYMSVPQYRHYVLTEKGINTIKELVVERSI